MVVRIAHNGLQIGDGRDFTTNVDADTKLSATTKLSAEHETPPIANVMLCVRATLLVDFNFCNNCNFVVRCLNFAKE